MIPAVVGAAVLLLAARSLVVPRLRQDPERAGEAFLTLAAVVAVGVVWYGRYVQVPRYLLPLSPVLALILARFVQLVGRRSRPLAATLAVAYLAVVAIGMAGDVTALSPRRWAGYWAERRDDEQLFQFLRQAGITRAYSYDYWLAPRLTFDAGEAVVVAQPFGDRYPPYTQAVDDSPRPAYILRTGIQRFRNWIEGIGSRAERRPVGPYTVLWNFAPPPAAVSLPRARWTVWTTPGHGEGGDLVDGRLQSGWASAKGPDGSAAVLVDLGQPVTVSGVTLVTDRSQHGPDRLQVAVDSGGDAFEPVATLEANGFAIVWQNGAPRTTPGRTLTVRFAPVPTRRLRLVDLGPGGTWAVAELFVLAPPGTAPAAASEQVTALVAEGRRLERAGELGPALVHYRQATRVGPDVPDGYAEFARLGADVGLRGGSPVEQAEWYTNAGLVEEARERYASLAASLGPERVDAELARRRAALAARAGDRAEATELEAAAVQAAAPPERVGATLGGVVELSGLTVRPARARPGEALEVTYYWRLLRPPSEPLAAYLHFRGDGARNRFGDDHALPEPIAGLPRPQVVVERRRIVVPADVEPGRYRLVAGVWNPATGGRLRRWWGGLVPTLDTAVELGTLEVLARP